MLAKTSRIDCDGRTSNNSIPKTSNDLKIPKNKRRGFRGKPINIKVPDIKVPEDYDVHVFNKSSFSTITPGTIAGSHRTEIISGRLHVGSSIDANDDAFLQENKISAIVSLGSAISDSIVERIGADNYLHINIADSSQTNILQYFPCVNTFIDSHQTTLVHCMAGISRSSACAIAYIMKTQVMSCKEAFQFVKSKRPIVSPNFSFIGQLEAYGQRLEKDRDSVISAIRKQWISNKSLSDSALLSNSPPNIMQAFVKSHLNNTIVPVLQRQNVSCTAQIQTPVSSRERRSRRTTEESRG